MARRSDNYKVPQGSRYKVHYMHNGNAVFMVVYASNVNDAANGLSQLDMEPILM